MLQRLRRERGIKQTDLAKAVGVTQPHLSQLESGSAGASVDLLHRLAEQLGLNEAERGQLLNWAAEQSAARRDAA